MASFNVAADEKGVHDKTLVGSAVDTVVFKPGADYIEVLTDGTAAVYFTVDGSTPTVSGSHCFKVPVATTSVASLIVIAGSTTVKLISAATPIYSVTRAEATTPRRR